MPGAVPVQDKILLFPQIFYEYTSSLPGPRVSTRIEHLRVEMAINQDKIRTQMFKSLKELGHLSQNCFGRILRTLTLTLPLPF